jgi:uncharacterized membrane protein HdeD (DUF308 family)
MVAVGTLLLAERWFVVAARGVATVLLGALVLTIPDPSPLRVAALFGGWALANGAAILAVSLRRAARATRGRAMAAEGFGSLAAGALALAWPRVDAVALALLVGGWAVFSGGAQLAAASWLRRSIHGEWRLGSAGVLAFALGAVLLAGRGEGMLALVLWLGIYALAAGGLSCALSMRLRALLFPRTPRRRPRPLVPVRV